MIDLKFWPWGARVVLRGGVNFLPRASIVHGPASLSSNYANTYMDALRLNAENYGNIMQGYNQTM